MAQSNPTPDDEADEASVDPELADELAARAEDIIEDDAFISFDEYNDETADE